MPIDRELLTENDVLDRQGREDPPKHMTVRDAAKYWNEQITVALKEQQPYHREAAYVTSCFRNGRHQGGDGNRAQKKRRYNTLYSNVETLRGALYAKSGKPDIRQRWTTDDPMAKTISEVLERCLTISIDDRRYEVAHESAVLMVCLTGRAVMRYDVETEMGMAPPPTGAQATPLKKMPVVKSQGISRTLVATSDFLHAPAPAWTDVWWVAFRHRFTREEMREHKFSGWKNVALNWSPDRGDGKPIDEADDKVRRAEVWEVWSRVHRQRFFICKDHDTALRIDDDPLGLSGFFPMQDPLQFVPCIDGTCLPQLDWWQYERMADDLEELNNRIAHLTKALKYRGVRDASVKELAKLAGAPDNTFLAVENMAALAQKGGIEHAFQALPIRDLATTLMETIKAADQLEQKIDRMSGIADIMRGGSEGPVKTATEQRIKSQYGGIRLKMRQRAVQSWIRDGMRIEAELIADHFEPDVLSDMTGIEVDDELIAFLRDNRAKHCRIDVETDSTIFEDAEAQKEANAQVTQTCIQLMEKGVAVMQAAPEMSNVVFELLSMTLRTLKGGRNIEDVIDQARQQMEQRGQEQAQQGQQGGQKQQGVGQGPEPGAPQGAQPPQEQPQGAPQELSQAQPTPPGQPQLPQGVGGG